MMCETAFAPLSAAYQLVCTPAQAAAEEEVQGESGFEKTAALTLLT